MSYANLVSVKRISDGARLKWLAISLSAVLSACGGGGGSDTGDELSVDYSALKVADVSEAPLTNSDDEAVLEYLRNGLRLSLRGSGPITGLSTAATAMASGAPSPIPNVFSQTTVQVEGVDESDAVKYDGTHIYVLRADHVGNVAPPLPPPGFAVPLVFWPSYEGVLSIARTDAAAATVTPVSQLRLPGRYSMAPTLYRQSFGGSHYVTAVGQADTRPGATSNRIAIDLVDVTTPAQPQVTWQMQIEGMLRTSRRIDNTLYVVSSFWPSIVALNYAANTDGSRRENERLIRAAGADLLPKQWQDGVQAPLVRPRDCLLPANRQSYDAYRELVVITAIDLSTRRVSDAACISSGENGLYMSRDSVYVGGTRYEPGTAPRRTVFNKFALSNGQLEYRATGAVEGDLGWQNSSYFMDEHEGDLRVVTTVYRGSDFSHHLSVLREAAGNRLELLATLPNASRPAPIGKPRERIQAVRFAGERAYVVTFLQIDPLYVIDLRTPSDPLIAGELEVPGFSTYLRPVGDRYLLGVGRHIDGTTLAGTKIELFDVSNLRQPRSVGAQIFGRASGDGLFDPHALTFMPMPGVPGRMRMALELSVYDTPMPNSSGYYSWTYTGLHLLDIDGAAADALQLRFRGVMVGHSPSNFSASSETPARGILHNDSVFYVHGEYLEAQRWPN